MNSKPKNSADFRNTLYKFHDDAVAKYKLRSQEIAVYTALLAGVKTETGKVQRSNANLMEAAGISNRNTFRKARDRLIEHGIIEIVKKGKSNTHYTIYKIMLLGRPVRRPDG